MSAVLQSLSNSLPLTIERPSYVHYPLANSHPLIIEDKNPIISSNYSSLSSNLIYGIHYSYYSILISLSIENLFVIC